MKKLLLIPFFLVFSNFLHSQELTKNNTPKNQRLGFSVGYYGHKITNTGVQIGLERYLSTTQNFNVLASFMFTGFSVKDVYKAVSFTPRIGFRYTANWGLTAETAIGLGYLQRFYQYEQYDLNDNGQLVKTGKAKLASAMPNFTVGVGYDFRKKTGLNALYFIRFGMNYNYPNKHYFYDQSTALETGIVWVPKFGGKSK